MHSRLVRGICLGIVLGTTISMPLFAAEPLLEKIDLFESNVDGYALYRIPGIVVTPRGTILAYCEARQTGKSDWDTIDIMLRRSTDGGKTWELRRKIADVPGPKTKNPVALAQNLGNTDDVTYNNPVAIVDPETGAVHFLFCLEYARCFYLRSDDDGLNWTPPVEITETFETFRTGYDWKVLATGPGHGIRISQGPHQGRLVVPVWLSTGTGGHAHRPSAVSVIFSDDAGKSWKAGEFVVKHPELKNPSETIVVELADGRVMLNIRHESASHRRAVTISDDGATGWSPLQLDDALLEPICMASILRVSGLGDGRKSRIVYANPHNLKRVDGKEEPEKNRERMNLSVKLSHDDGRTWPFDKPLEPGFSAYSDLSRLADGTILCFYERSDRDERNRHLRSRLTVARFNLEWLTDGKDSFE